MPQTLLDKIANESKPRRHTLLDKVADLPQKPVTAGNAAGSILKAGGRATVGLAAGAVEAPAALVGLGASAATAPQQQAQSRANYLGGQQARETIAPGSTRAGYRALLDSQMDVPGRGQNEYDRYRSGLESGRAAAEQAAMSWPSPEEAADAVRPVQKPLEKAAQTIRSANDSDLLRRTWPHRDRTFKEAVSDPKWWLEDFSEGALSMVGNIVPGTLAGKASTLKMLGGASKIEAAKTTAAVSSALLTASEMGNQYDDLKRGLMEKGMPESSASLIASRGAVPFAVASGLIERGILPKQLDLGSQTKGVGGWLMRVVSGGAGELTEEEAQMLTGGLSKWAVGLDPNLSWDEAMKTGLTAAGGGGAMRGLSRSDPTPTPRNRQTPRSKAWKEARAATSPATEPVAEAVSDTPTPSISQRGPTAATEMPPDAAGSGEVRRADADESPQAAMGAAATGELDPFPVGTKNASTEQWQDRLGVVRNDKTVESVTQWDEEAKATLERNPNAGLQLVNELTDKPRNLSDRETAVWLNYQAGVQSEYQNTIDALEQTRASGNESAVRDLEAREQSLNAQLEDVFDVIQKAGTEWGRSGVARQMMLNQDLTLADMMRRRRAATHRDLTPEERAETAALFKQIEQLKAQLAEAESKQTQASEDESWKLLGEDSKQPEQDADATESDDLYQFIQQSALKTIREGTAARPEVVDAVTAAVEAKFALRMDRAEVAEILSDYGNSKQMNQDPAMKQRRQIKAELRALQKIRDMRQGQPPKATGLQRDAPGDTLRRAEKLVNEAKKRYGVETTNPARQLRSWLDARKTVTRNRIRDLRKAVKSKQRLVRQKAAGHTDSELQSLIAERDALQSEYNEIFGKPGLSAAQRVKNAIAAAEKSLAEYDRRISEGDFTRKPGKATPVTSELKAIRAQRDAKKAEYDALKALDPAAKAEAQEIADLRFIEQAQKRIADLEERMAKSDFAMREKKAVERGAKATAVKAELDKVVGEWNDKLHNARLQQKYTDDIAALKSNLASGIIPEKKTRENRKLSPDVYRLRRQREILLKQQEVKRNELNRTLMGKLWDTTGLLRLLQTTGEFSWAGIQLGKLGISGVGSAAHGNFKPIRRWGRAVLRGIRATANEHVAKEIDERVFNHVNLQIWEDAKLRLIHEGEHISGSEHVKIASWVDKIPVIKNFNRGARVAYNEIRTSAFDALTLMERNGAGLDPERAKNVAKLVNTLTGYGDLAKYGNASEPLWSQVLYSPRNLAANVRFVVGEPLWRGDAQTRKQAAKVYANYIIGLGAIYALGALAGGDVEDDPRSTDFLKIRFGNTRINPLIGIQNLIVLGARVFTGEKKQADGKVVALRERFRPLNWIRDTPVAEKRPFRGETAWDTATRFARGKLSPHAGLIVDLTNGTTVIGDDVVSLESGTRFMPITYADIYDAMREHGVPKGAAMGGIAFFGVGLQTYESRPSQGSTRQRSTTVDY